MPLMTIKRTEVADESASRPRATTDRKIGGLTEVEQMRSSGREVVPSTRSVAEAQTRG
jgi:hypothetical protein